MGKSELKSINRMLFIAFKFKLIAEKMREFLPQPSISNSQTVEVEHSTEPSTSQTDDFEGGGEVMATLDERENLV